MKRSTAIMHMHHTTKVDISEGFRSELSLLLLGNNRTISQFIQNKGGKCEMVQDIHNKGYQCEVVN